MVSLSSELSIAVMSGGVALVVDVVSQGVWLEYLCLK